MSEQVAQADFTGCVTETFRVSSAGLEGVELTLDRLTVQPAPPRQENFTLLFHGPAQRPLGQGIQSLEHERLGQVDIFLVPVGRDEKGFLYEAVFNRMVPV